jgi:hypothetical protein
MRKVLQHLEDQWGDAEMVPVKEIAADLKVGQEWVVRRALRAKIEVAVLLTKAPHLTRRDASALSQLKVRVGKIAGISHVAWHKEVCHAEKVHRAADGSRAR